MESPVENEQPPYKYWAFISYNQNDRAWAKWLYGMIDAYRVPEHVVGSQKDIGPSERLFPVFLDREELAGAESIDQPIKEALRDSRFLIVICSPNAAKSAWVNEEIEIFTAMGRGDRVLCLVVGGEPNSISRAGFDGQECFPEAIRIHLGADTEATEMRAGPIVADVRPGKDGRNDAVLKLIAGMLGVSYDELRLPSDESRVLQT